MTTADPGREAAGPPVLTRSARDGAVAEIVLNRPHARNAITLEMAAGLHEALLAAAERARVIVIRGAAGQFCSGGDFGEVARLQAAGPVHCESCSRRSPGPAS